MSLKQAKASRESRDKLMGKIFSIEKDKEAYFNTAKEADAKVKKLTEEAERARKEAEECTGVLAHKEDEVEKLKVSVA